MIRIRKRIPNLWVFAVHHQRTITNMLAWYAALCVFLYFGYPWWTVAISVVCICLNPYYGWQRWKVIKANPMYGLYEYPAEIQLFTTGIKPTVMEWLDDFKARLEAAPGLEVRL
jgi:hypothetical protein